MELAKEAKVSFVADVLENRDTLKQLLARSRYLLFKKQQDWSVSQIHRAEILFRSYPDLQQAYQLSRQLSDIFTHSKERIIAFKKLALWYNDVEKASFKTFNIIAKTIENNYEKILNFFDNRSTNASAESFNRNGS
jgi:transposase